MSLRRRLVVGMLLSLIAAIVVTDLVSSDYLRSFLIGRLDEQMEVAQNQAYTYIYATNARDRQAHEALATSNPQAWLSQLTTVNNPSCGQSAASLRSGRSSASRTPTSRPAAGGSTGGVPSPRLNGSLLAARDDPDVYLEVLTASGTVVFSDPSGSCASPDPVPVLPKHLPVQAVPPSHVFGRNHGVYLPDRPSFEVAALGTSGPHYRAQAVAVPGGTLVTAIALDPTYQTLASLTHVELAVSAGVVLALLVLVLWVVRFGLRPLYDMTETARAIADGDLTRRIHQSDERSEVGRLGAALNGMLSQIEAAFGERASSETRLRRFVADASHELRTPLTSIRGYAELLRKGAFDDEDGRRRAVERIEHEAARMSLLVDDLLLLARLDQGRPFERVPVDLGGVASDAVDAARAVEPHRAITLDVRGDVLAEGDAARLRQVVDNLLRNAEVHTPGGTPVHVKVSRRGALALVSVEDEGPGIDAQDQESLRPLLPGQRGADRRRCRAGPLDSRRDRRGSRGLRPSRECCRTRRRLPRRAPGSPDGPRGVRCRRHSWRRRLTLRTRRSSRGRRGWRGRRGETGRGLDDQADARRRGPEPQLNARAGAAVLIEEADAEGVGPNVLCIHGQPGLGMDFDAVARLLEADHRVLQPDRPGYGRGSDHAVSMRENALVLGRCLEDSGAAPATVVGHSYGGGIAILLAAGRPDLVSGLVLVGSVGRKASLVRFDHLLGAPFVGDVVSAVSLFTLGHVLPLVRAVASVAPSQVAQRVEVSLPDSAYLEMISERGRSVWRSFVFEQRSLLEEIGEVESSLKQVTVPTVVVAGEWDMVVPPSVAVSIANAVEHSRLVMVPRTGHFVPRDAPDVIAEAVRSLETGRRSLEVQ